MSKLEAIKKVVVDAVPEIMELKFGCEVKCNGETTAIYAGSFGKKHLVLYKDSLHQRGRKPLEEEMLGRPIRLADVLAAAIKTNPANRTRLMVEGSGQFRDDVVHVLGPYWNLLKDDLSEQSPETIDFLYTILCPNLP